MNDWNPATSQMNQQCKVCGEPAAGFHFGAFTCEGCKSFFGRSYNNLSSISECKNGGQCVINKKNRTSCKACRLKKCLIVGMSKSGSRYGRRSNWFKIHCLLQEQANSNNNNTISSDMRLYESSRSPPQLPSPNTTQRMLQQQFAQQQTRAHHHHHEDSDRDYKTSSPSISSPESHNSDSSVEISDARLGLLNGHLAAIRSATTNTTKNGNPICDPKDFFMPLPFLPPGLMQTSPLAAAAAAAMAAQHAQKFLFPHGSPAPYLGLYPPPPQHPSMKSSTETEEMICSKRFYLDAILQSQRNLTSTPIITPEPQEKQQHKQRTHEKLLTIPSPMLMDQDNPMDLSMKSSRISSPMESDDDDNESESCKHDNESDVEQDKDEEEFSSSEQQTDVTTILKGRTTPLDLTTRLETAA